MLLNHLDAGKIEENSIPDMELVEQLEKTLKSSHDWAVDRIHTLCEDKDFESAHAIQSEFSEWMNPDISEHDVFSLEYIGEE